MNFHQSLQAPLVLVAVVATLTGLASAPTQAADPVAAEIELVTLARTPCYGRCPDYSVQIGKNGSVTYIGREDVTQRGNRNATVPTEDFEILKSAIRLVDFQQFQANYESKEDGCRDIATDFPSIVITVRRGTEEKSVKYYLGCRGPESALRKIRWLAETIDQVAGTRRWVGKD